MKKIIAGLLAVLLLAAVVTACGADDERVTAVKNSYLRINGAPYGDYAQTIGEAFDSYFAGTRVNWSVSAEDGDSYTVTAVVTGNVSMDFEAYAQAVQFTRISFEFRYDSAADTVEYIGLETTATHAGSAAEFSTNNGDMNLIWAIFGRPNV